MKKFVCTVCGYVHEGDAAPAECPVCHAPASKFKEQEGDKVWAAEHVVGVAQGVSEDSLADLRANFAGECSEVGMYLAMARVAHREGYPEIGLYWEKAAYEDPDFPSGKSNSFFNKRSYFVFNSSFSESRKRSHPDSLTCTFPSNAISAASSAI